MPRFVRRPIVNSIKHIPQFPATGIASGAESGFSLVVAVAKGAARTTAAVVEEGCIIKAVFLEIWVKADSPNFTVISTVTKIPGGGTTSPDFTEMNNLSSYENKKNILEIHEGLAPSGGNVVPLYRHWIKIPKGKQRFGLDDTLTLNIAFVGSDGDMCGFCTFKEYE